GSMSANGGLALSPGRRDSLGLVFTSDSLGGIRSYLAGASTDSTSKSPLAGSLEITGGLTGWLDSLGLSGTIGGSGVRTGGFAVHGFSGTFDLPRLRAPARGSAELALEGTSLGNVALDHV